jgi:hypothetical protein
MKNIIKIAPILAYVPEDAGPVFIPEESLKCAHGINTAIGCIPIDDKNAFSVFLLQWAIGIAGGIALLFIARGAFTIMTSSGNPDRMNAGKELIVASLSGLIFLVLSTVILKIIGVDIFALPGF